MINSRTSDLCAESRHARRRTLPHLATEAAAATTVVAAASPCLLDKLAPKSESSAAPATSGTLSALDHEYVYIAFACSPTHMFEPGLELHMRTALELGATAVDLLAVLKLVSGIGFEATIIGQQLLAEMGSLSAVEEGKDGFL